MSNRAVCRTVLFDTYIIRKSEVYAIQGGDRKMDLKGRHFLKLLDFTPEEILYLVDVAADRKSVV